MVCVIEEMADRRLGRHHYRVRPSAAVGDGQQQLPRQLWRGGERGSHRLPTRQDSTLQVDYCMSYFYNKIQYIYSAIITQCSMAVSTV